MALIVCLGLLPGKEEETKDERNERNRGFNIRRECYRGCTASHIGSKSDINSLFDKIETNFDRIYLYPGI